MVGFAHARIATEARFAAGQSRRRREDYRFMLHVTCDHCGKQMRAGEDRYVVKIEVFAAHDPAEITEADLEEDHMEAVSELLRELEARGIPTPSSRPRAECATTSVRRAASDSCGIRSAASRPRNSISARIEVSRDALRRARCKRSAAQSRRTLFHSPCNSRRFSSIARTCFCMSSTRSRCCCTTSAGALSTKLLLPSLARAA